MIRWIWWGLAMFCFLVLQQSLEGMVCLIMAHLISIEDKLESTKTQEDVNASGE